MARAGSTFRQSDLKRAVKAVTGAGISIAKVEIETTGKIVLTTGAAEAAEMSDLDKWKASRASQT